MKRFSLVLLSVLMLFSYGCTAPNEPQVIECYAGSDDNSSEVPSETLPIAEPIGDETGPYCIDPRLDAELYDLTDDEYAAYMDFTLRLLKGCTASDADSDAEPKEENMMISPLSVITALGMTANGAKNETLSQLESAIGLDLATLNMFLSSYLDTFPNGDGYRLTPANSVWYRDTESLHVEPDFLQNMNFHLNADVYPEAFDDSTCEKINEWVYMNTDGMIKKLLDEIPTDVVMYLINALAFDSEWAEEYKDTAVHENTFTTASGIEQSVDMMYSEESRYLRSDDALGFLKFYKDEKYAFVGILPNEGITLDDYIADLTPGKLTDMLGTVYGDEINARLPKFEAEYSVTMNDQLKSMGITDLFDSASCDLSGMAQSDAGNIYVSRVLHKTFISVDEKGTKAAAVTAVECTAESISISEPINIWLDRPFLYMIVEWENRVPVFIGTVETFAE